STKNRQPLLSPDVQARLYPYFGAVTRNHLAKLLEVGGMPDHVHLLIELSSIDKFSHFIRSLKACSSQWIHKHFSDLQDFAWQEGYGSFSVSYSVLESVRKYIQNQQQHHAKMSFEEEFIKFLELHQVNYDKRFVLG